MSLGLKTLLSSTFLIWKNSDCNNSLYRNSNFANVPTGATYGFLYISKSSANILFEDFVLRDIAITNRVAFMLMAANTTGQTPMPYMKVKNVIVENVFEVPFAGSATSLSLFQHIQGNVSLEYSNLTITNVQLQCRN